MLHAALSIPRRTTGTVEYAQHFVSRPSVIRGHWTRVAWIYCIVYCLGFSVCVVYFPIWFTFVSVSKVILWENCFGHDLNCVGCGGFVKLLSLMFFYLTRFGFLYPCRFFWLFYFSLLLSSFSVCWLSCIVELPDCDISRMFEPFNKIR